jgi:hypothetical protein
MGELQYARIAEVHTKRPLGMHQKNRASMQEDPQAIKCTLTRVTRYILRGMGGEELQI